jgi:hypothetical protein
VEQRGRRGQGLVGCGVVEAAAAEQGKKGSEQGDGAWKLAAGGGEGGQSSGAPQCREVEQHQRRKRKGIFLGICL